MSAADLDRRTALLALRQSAARSELMVAFAGNDAAAEHATRAKMHDLLDVELDQLAERVRLLLNGGPK